MEGARRGSWRSQGSTSAENRTQSSGNVNEEAERSILKSRTDEVVNYSEVQKNRLAALKMKMKAIEFEVLTEYGRQQIHTAISAFALVKGVALPKFKSHHYARERHKKYDEYEDPSEKVDDSLQKRVKFNKKHDLEDLKDVTIQLRTTMKESLRSTYLSYNDEVTDSNSEGEDEIEKRASYKTHKEYENYQGYLPVEESPVSKYARYRQAIKVRLLWLKHAILGCNGRINQQDVLINMIRKSKPRFQFDESCNRKPPSTPNASALKGSTIKIFHEDKGIIIKKNDVVFKKLPKSTLAAGGGGKSISDREQALNKIRELIRKSKKGSAGGDGNSNGKVGGGLEALKLKILDRVDPSATARRCMPISSYLPRKIIRVGGLHHVVGKLANTTATALCPCYGRTELCLSCAGRSYKIETIRNGTMSKKDIVALLDHTYHKPLSTSEEKPLNRLFESSFKTKDWTKPLSLKAELNNVEESEEEEENAGIVEIKPPVLLKTCPVRRRPVVVMKSPIIKKVIGRPRRSETKIAKVPPLSTPTTKKYKKRKAARKVSEEVSDDEFDEEDEDYSWTTTAKRPKPSSSDYASRRKRDEKYDIDHIVIPNSFAAATRVEKIEYKEIMIPSWRKRPVERLVRSVESVKAGVRHTRRQRYGSNKELDETVEDISLATIQARHNRSEVEEKKRFMSSMNKLMSRRTRRSESKSETVDNNLVPLLPEAEPLTVYKTEEPTPGTSNQISAAEASLAVTALKYSNINNGSRRRTASLCRIEDEELEEPTFTPFERRVFPLSEMEYAKMCDEMTAAIADNIQNNHVHSA